MGTVAAAKYSSILDLYAAVSDLAAQHPTLFGTISLGAIGGILWAYWKRPIINVHLGKKAGSHGPVPILGQIIQAMYFRVLVKNAGLTTIKDCSGQLLKVMRGVAGRKPECFETERYVFGWAHYPQSDKRDIARWQSFRRWRRRDFAHARCPPSPAAPASAATGSSVARSRFKAGGLVRSGRFNDSGLPQGPACPSMLG